MVEGETSGLNGSTSSRATVKGELKVLDSGETCLRQEERYEREGGQVGGKGTGTRTSLRVSIRWL